MIEQPAIVRKDEDSEVALIKATIEAITECSWRVGELAFEWTKKYAKGRTDKDFGELVGLSLKQVNQRRLVYQMFGDVRQDYPGLTFSHFRVALAWPNAEECLAWAVETDSSYMEMQAWQRSLNGGDVSPPSEPEPEIFEQCVDPDPPPAPPTINKAPLREPADDFKPAKRSEAKPAPAFSSHAVTPEQPRNGQPIESRSFTLEELRKLIVAAEDTSGDAHENKRLAKWHRERADELDPPETVTPASAIVAEWNLIPDVARCAKVTPKRAASVKARMRDPFWRENWREAMQKVSESTFCRGENDQGWIANIEWFLRPETVVNLIEGGKYGGNGSLNANLERFLEQG